jgi:hypothetical protein
VLGRDAASILPIEALSGGAIRAPWGWQATALGRSLATVEPAIARDGRVVFLVDSGGAEGLVAAALGGVQAGFRLVRARLEDGDEELTGTIELIPPGAVAPPGPRTRGNQPLDALWLGRRRPTWSRPRPVRRPERSTAAVLPGRRGANRRRRRRRDDQGRGEPARYERVLGEILVGLDRADDAAGGTGRSVGHGAAPVEGATSGDPATPRDGAPERGPVGPFDDGESAGGRHSREPTPATEQAPAAGSARATQPEAVASDKVDRLLELIRAELGRPDHRRIREIEPGRWWLVDREDIAAAAAPLADRVEWAVFSLLSTAGPLAESSFFERVAGLFTGHDLPDESPRPGLPPELPAGEHGRSRRDRRRPPGPGSSMPR